MTDRKPRTRPRWPYRALCLLAALSAGFYFPSAGLAAMNAEAERLVALVREGSIAKLAAYLETPGADINARPDVDKALLDYAAEQNQVQVATWLLDHGADINAAQQKGLTPGITALHRAAYFDAFEVAQLLIERGADVNANRAATPLMFAASAGHARMIELLLQHGAKLASGRQTAVASAASQRRLDIIELLQQHGAEMNDEQALNDAALRQHSEVVRYLLNHEQSQTAKNTALRLAVIGADTRTDTASLDIVTMLIEAGADVNNTADSAPNTPLMLAKRADLRQLLLAHGATDLGSIRAEQERESELRHILISLGRWRECGPALDIESVREARTIVTAGAGWNEADARWQHLKDVIAQDLRYDMGPLIVARADQIDAGWQRSLTTSLTPEQRSELLQFFDSDAGHRYLIFQSRLSALEDSAVVISDAAPGGPPATMAAGPNREVLGDRYRLLELAWGGAKARYEDDPFCEPLKGRAKVQLERIIALAGTQIDALQMDYRDDLPAFGAFQQSAAATAAAAAGRRILGETATTSSGSAATWEAALRRATQIHAAEWSAEYRAMSDQIPTNAVH